MADKVTVRRLAVAYLNVLGRPEAGSEDQQLVWRDIEIFCRAHRPTTELTRELRLDNVSTFINEGRRSFWIRARGHVKFALAPTKTKT